MQALLMLSNVSLSMDLESSPAEVEHVVLQSAASINCFSELLQSLAVFLRFLCFDLGASDVRR